MPLPTAACRTAWFACFALVMHAVVGHVVVDPRYCALCTFSDYIDVSAKTTVFVDHLSVTSGNVTFVRVVNHSAIICLGDDDAGAAAVNALLTAPAVQQFAVFDLVAIARANSTDDLPFPPDGVFNATFLSSGDVVLFLPRLASDLNITSGQVVVLANVSDTTIVFQFVGIDAMVLRALFITVPPGTLEHDFAITQISFTVIATTGPESTVTPTADPTTVTAMASTTASPAIQPTTTTMPTTTALQSSMAPTSSSATSASDTTTVTSAAPNVSTAAAANGTSPTTSAQQTVVTAAPTTMTTTAPSPPVTPQMFTISFANVTSAASFVAQLASLLGTSAYDVVQSGVTVTLRFTGSASEKASDSTRATQLFTAQAAALGIVSFSSAPEPSATTPSTTTPSPGGMPSAPSGMSDETKTIIGITVPLGVILVIIIVAIIIGRHVRSKQVPVVHFQHVIAWELQRRRDDGSSPVAEMSGVESRGATGSRRQAAGDNNLNDPLL